MYRERHCSFNQPGCFENGQVLWYNYEVKSSEKSEKFQSSWQNSTQMGAKKILQNFITLAQHNGEQLPHAFLFLGPAHSGKYQLALAFAHKLRTTLQNQSEVYEFDIAASDGVGNLRELIQFSNLTAANRASKKIFVVKNFQDASVTAQNTLLKTLEEPARSAVFILVSNHNSALPTILSRCVAVRCFATENGSLDINERQQRVLDALSGQQSGLLLQLKELQDMDTPEISTLLQSWVQHLLAEFAEQTLERDIQRIRAAQVAHEDLQHNYNSKLILQEFLLQTEKYL